MAVLRKFVVRTCVLTCVHSAAAGPSTSPFPTVRVCGTATAPLPSQMGGMGAGGRFALFPCLQTIVVVLCSRAADVFFLCVEIREKTAGTTTNAAAAAAVELLPTFYFRHYCRLEPTRPDCAASTAGLFCSDPSCVQFLRIFNSAASVIPPNFSCYM